MKTYSIAHYRTSGRNMSSTLSGGDRAVAKSLHSTPNGEKRSLGTPQTPPRGWLPLGTLLLFPILQQPWGVNRMLDFCFKMSQNINVIDNNQTSYRVDNHVTSMVLAVRSARSVLAPYYVSCLYGKMLHGKVQQPGVRLYETRHRIERDHCL